jgi:hypothetical protein
VFPESPPSKPTSGAPSADYAFAHLAHLPFVDQNVRVGVQRHRLLRVSELRRQVGNRDALGDLHARVAVPEVVRVEVRDARGDAGPRHHVLRHVRREAGEDPPLGHAVVGRAGLLGARRGAHQRAEASHPPPSKTRQPPEDQRCRCRLVEGPDGAGRPSEWLLPRGSVGPHIPAPFFSWRNPRRYQTRLCRRGGLFSALPSLAPAERLQFEQRTRSPSLSLPPSATGTMWSTSRLTAWCGMPSSPGHTWPFAAIHRSRNARRWRQPARLRVTGAACPAAALQTVGRHDPEPEQEPVSWHGQTVELVAVWIVIVNDDRLVWRSA